MKANKLFWILWLVWLVLNVLTGLMQEIHPDEAYYHLFGQYLAWGYFDHPPMVGLMAWLSDHLMCHTTMWGLHNLTVRLMTLLTFGLTLWLVWRTTTDDRPVSRHFVITFFLVAAGMVMFSTSGFMLTPDSPLMLFVAVFYYAYQQYLQGKRPWLWALVLGVAIAGMFYSKYMGVLVVAFTVLSNWRLIKDGRLWCALALALLLLTPHLLWQFNHDWPTLQYHLVARHGGFTWQSILEYWPNQLVVYNPLSLVLMLCAGWVAIRRSRSNRFEGALAASIWGFLFFFWTMTLKGHAEPHWTMAISIPAIILLTRYLEDGTIAWMQCRWVRVTLWVMVGICLLARVVLWTNILPIQTGLGSKHPRYDAIHDLASDRVVVFKGSFQTVSMYRFWVGDAVLTHDIYERHTQYELVNIDSQYQGQPACILEQCPGAMDTLVCGQVFPWKLVDRLQLTDRIAITPIEWTVQQDSLCGTLTAYNPYDVDFVWHHEQMPARLYVVAAPIEHNWPKACLMAGPDTIPSHEYATYHFAANWHELTGATISEQMSWVFAICNDLAVTKNSSIYSIKVP